MPYTSTITPYVFDPVRPPPPVFNFPAITINTTVINNPTPVSATFDPKIEANQLYGKPMALAAIGSKPVRFAGSPAPLVGPYINAGNVDFIVSIALVVPVDGTRKLFKVYLDQELAWSSATGWDGSGAQPGDAIYHAESFDLAFRPGTLTQTVLSLETVKFPGDENAYRPQVLIEIRNLPYQRYMDQSGRPVPYVSCEIGDFSDGRGPDEQINLGEALELIAHSPWAGYTSSTFEAVDITDAVDGIIIKDNFTVVNLCQSVTRLYRNIDLLQSDILRVRDRGNVSPDFVFDRDSILGDVKSIQIFRSGATLQRRELELVAIDPDQDYTAVPSLSQIPRNPFVISAAVGKETITSPLVLDASTRQALVTYAQQYEENARKKIVFKAMVAGYEIEPGDLVALVDIADGISNEVWKVTQTVHGANFVVEIEAEAILRCSIPQVADPDFGEVILLLHCDGTNGSTTFTDSSSFANTMTASGHAQITTTSPVFGTGAGLFDGTGDFVSTGALILDAIGLSPTNTSPFTIECWVIFDLVSQAQFLVGADGGLGNRWFRFTSTAANELKFEWTTSSGGNFDASLTTSGASLTALDKIFCVVDKDSAGTIRIYSGLEGGAATMLAKATPASSSIAAFNHPISIGASQLGSLPLDGRLDDVRITRGASRYGAVYGDASFPVPTEAFLDT